MSPFRSIARQKEPVKRRSHALTARLAPFYSSCCLSREVQDGDNDGETAFVLLDQLQTRLCAITARAVCRRGPEGYLQSCSTGQLARKSARRQQRLGYLRSGHCQ